MNEMSGKLRLRAAVLETSQGVGSVRLECGSLLGRIPMPILIGC
jgi:hypothetical protein